MPSPCNFGSKKQDSAPQSFTIDTGGFCFALGIDNVLCPLIDKIPSYVGQTWKSILKEILKDTAGLVVDLATGQIDTESFCSTAPPNPPAEITYADVFGFFASYVPPLSLIASTDPLLAKIQKSYLYAKWFQLCRCKTEQEIYDDTEEFPLLGEGCFSNAEKTAANNYLAALNAANTQGALNAAENNANQPDLGDLVSQQFAALIALGYEPQSRNITPPPIPERPTYNGGQAFGCILISVTGFYADQYTTAMVEVFIVYEGVEYNRGNYYTTESRPSFISPSVDTSGCVCPDPPPTTTYPPDPSGDCPPLVPPQFCSAFPDDPRCSNVPPPDNGGGSGEPTVIEVVDYTCANGEFNKNVTWNL